VRSSFSQAVSGTDLVVGARTGPVQLMLYAVFRIGGATNNIGMDSLKAVAAHRAVAWLVPISLGDSHRGRPVLGTTPAYFDALPLWRTPAARAGRGARLCRHAGRAVRSRGRRGGGAALGYRPGQRLTLSHGSGALPGTEHADKPFTVVGVLAPTGTPVDRSVHVSLQAIEAIHLDWAGGAPLPGLTIAAGQARKFDLEPKQVTAALVGLKSRAAVFVVQRWVADYEGEPLLAVLPGVALDELWQVLGVGEQALQLMTALVAVVSLASLVAVVLAGLEQRRRELAVLRAVGAAPRHVLALLAIEGAIVTTLGTLAGALGSAGLAVLAAPWLQQAFGIQLTPSAPTAAQWGLFAATLAAGMLAALLPGVRAYRLSLADGLSPPT
jgi:putative ABC transport system permease protein